MIYEDGVFEEDLHTELVCRLRVAQQFAGFEFEITSGYREGDSGCHGQRKAVDIRCWTSERRFRLVQSLIRAGFIRIGVYDKHVHSDTCEEMPQGVMWTGVSS